MPEYVCPNCKRSDRLAEVNLITGYARGGFNADGEFIFHGYTDVDWDSQITVPEGEQYICLACGTRFNSPAVIKRHKR